VSGLALWILVIARVCWRVSHAPPGLPADIGAPYRHLSRAAHWALYALLFVTPIIGIVTFIWHGRTFDFGLFQVNPGIARNRAVFEPTEDVHGYLAYALFAVAASRRLFGGPFGFYGGGRIQQHLLEHREVFDVAFASQGADAAKRLRAAILHAFRDGDQLCFLEHLQMPVQIAVRQRAQLFQIAEQ
jgi:hypothetical protein